MEKLQALNYSRQAIPDLMTFSKAIIDRYPQTSALVSDMAASLMSAAGNIFVMPFNGQIFDSDPTPSILPKFHLPYPIVVLEFPSYTSATSKSFSVVAPKRIVLCFEVTKYSNGRFTLAESGNATGVIVWPIFFSSEVGFWVPSWIGAHVSYGQTAKHEVPKDVELGGEIFRTREWMFGVSYLYLGEFGEEQRKKVPKDKEALISSADTTLEIEAVFQLCAALECNNVSSELIEPPEKLNKKLKKEGKLPLFSYRILVVNSGKKSFSKSEATGTHASPRTHLRRGHIRHLSEEKFTWVTSCVVNPGHGFAAKDYAVAK